jgi:very-short-patch-repair endonuclease
MTDDLDRPIRDLAARQHAVVATAQLQSAGLGRTARLHRVRAGVLEPLSRRVYRLAGSVPTLQQDLMAAVIDAGPGAAVSRESAAEIWGLPGFSPTRPQVTRLRSEARRRPALGDVHETGLLPPGHCSTSDGIPVTSIPRTLLDLAGTTGFPEPRLERALENAVSRSASVLPRLRTLVAELAVRGRPGIALMRELLEARPPGYVPPASGLEARVIALLEEVGIATRRQVDLGGEHWVGRVDLLVTDAPLVVECDSIIHHWSLPDRQRDARRDADLAAAGLTVVRITEDEAFHRPWVVAPRVVAARQKARASEPGEISRVPARDMAPSSPGPLA